MNTHRIGQMAYLFVSPTAAGVEHRPLKLEVVVQHGSQVEGGLDKYNIIILALFPE